jgi:hypothetical protein
MRILVVFEDDYRTYREVLAVGIRLLRPRAEVETASLEALGEHIERFDPELVICSGHEAVDPVGRPAWVELSVDPLQPAKIRVGERYSERTNPTLEVLVSVIDEVGELIQMTSNFRGC